MGSVVESRGNNMKVTIISGLLCAAVVTGDQTHHQSFKQGNAPSVHVSVHKPHYADHAHVSSQPAASPQSVHCYGSVEKPIVGVHAPAHVPYHAPEPYHAPAPYKAPEPYHAPPPPVCHKPAPYKAPVVHHAPVVHTPAYHAPAPKPTYHAPAPTYVPAKPTYHVPAPTYAPP